MLSKFTKLVWLTLHLQEELLAYHKQHGNSHVPTKYKENTALGRWVSTQRSEYNKYRKGSKSSMTQDKITQLEKVGFAWAVVRLDDE